MLLHDIICLVIRCVLHFVSLKLRPDSSDHVSKCLRSFWSCSLSLMDLMFLNSFVSSANIEFMAGFIPQRVIRVKYWCKVALKNGRDIIRVVSFDPGWLGSWSFFVPAVEIVSLFGLMFHCGPKSFWILLEVVPQRHIKLFSTFAKHTFNRDT
jgi:hypothetical protein